MANFTYKAKADENYKAALEAVKEYDKLPDDKEDPAFEKTKEIVDPAKLAQLKDAADSAATLARAATVCCNADLNSTVLAQLVELDIVAKPAPVAQPAKKSKQQ